MIQAATFEAIENAAKMFAAQPGPEPKSNGRFDVAAYLDHYGIGYKIKGNGSKTIYALDHCVFDPAHTNNDAAIFQFPDGKLGYKCHHDSCMGKGWQQARQAISGTDNLRDFMPGNESNTDNTGVESELTVCTLHEVNKMDKHFPEPIIDGLLEKGDSLLVTGPGGLGKSLVTLAIAV